MKKAIVGIMAVMLLTAAVALAGVTKVQAADVLKDILTDQGFICKVVVKDVDENNYPDYAIEYIGGNKGQEIIMLLATVTGAVTGLEAQVSFQSDKAYVLIGDTLYYATTKDIVRCGKMITKESTTEEDARACLEAIWDEVTDE